MEKKIETQNSSLHLWLQLIKCTKTIVAHVDGQLRRNHNLSLVRFDVLSQLYRFEDKWLTIGELANLLMASGGNITGLLDRMENDKQLKRRASPTDRRSFQVKLTKHGRGLFEIIAKDHESWVSDMMADLPEQGKKHLVKQLIEVRREFEKTTIKNNKSAA
ncbi:MAG: MarR family transcriptional regulator [Rhodospirillales bacterium]|jgi:DNA-binding MarR family transcriptional regulator